MSDFSTRTRAMKRQSAALAQQPPERRAWLALYAFGHLLLLMIPGVVLIAAGIRLGVRSFYEPGSVAAVWMLAAGVSTFCVGMALVRSVLRVPGRSVHGRLQWLCSSRRPLVSSRSGLSSR